MQAKAWTLMVIQGTCCVESGQFRPAAKTFHLVGKPWGSAQGVEIVACSLQCPAGLHTDEGSGLAEQANSVAPLSFLDLPHQCGPWTGRSLDYCWCPPWLHAAAWGLLSTWQLGLVAECIKPGLCAESFAVNVYPDVHDYSLRRCVVTLTSMTVMGSLRTLFWVHSLFWAAAKSIYSKEDHQIGLLPLESVFQRRGSSVAKPAW